MTTDSAPSALAEVAALGGADVEEVSATSAAAALSRCALLRPPGAAALAARPLAMELARLLCRLAMEALEALDRATPPLSALPRLLASTTLAASTLLRPEPLAVAAVSACVRLVRAVAEVAGGRGASAGT
jgi:hypothetical protein